MREYKVVVKGKELVIYQDDDGQFIIPNEIQELNKFGTALKPAYEPIIIARKPCEGSCVDNVMKYGVGGINIDECRVPTDDTWSCKEQETNAAEGYQRKNKSMYCQKSDGEMHENGRFPANLILTYDDTDFEEVCGGMPYTTTGNLSPYQEKETTSEIYGFNTKPTFRDVVHIGDEGSAARYFYCAKAGNKDREEGLDATKIIQYELLPDVPDEIVSKILQGLTPWC